MDELEISDYNLRNAIASTLVLATLRPCAFLSRVFVYLCVVLSFFVLRLIASDFVGFLQITIHYSHRISCMKSCV